MNETNLTKQIVSVTEMARMCGLSRARFYQLMNDGIFPSPSRNPETNRPFFDQEQQEQCLQVRRTNQGANGKAVMFYGFRAPGPQQPAKRKRLPNSKSSRNTANRDPVVTDLRHGLTQLGITESMTPESVRRSSTPTPMGTLALTERSCCELCLPG
jgi:predicted DNA-binding transcriptional regulator AlpA